jgi:hypothetical protein
VGAGRVVPGVDCVRGLAMINLVMYPYEGNIRGQLRDYWENRRDVERKKEKSKRKVEATAELKKQDESDVYIW